MQKIETLGLKESGNGLRFGDDPISPGPVEQVSLTLLNARSYTSRGAVVAVGGGNFGQGKRLVEPSRGERTRADRQYMRATQRNAEAIFYSLRERALDVPVGVFVVWYDEREHDHPFPLYRPELADKILDRNGIVLVARGTGFSRQSTDVLLFNIGEEVGVTYYLFPKDGVDAIYSFDPNITQAGRAKLGIPPREETHKFSEIDVRDILANDSITAIDHEGLAHWKAVSKATLRVVRNDPLVIDAALSGKEGFGTWIRNGSPRVLGVPRVAF